MTKYLEDWSFSEISQAKKDLEKMTKKQNLDFQAKAKRAIEEPILFPSETILPDDYPIYADYFYIADGKPILSDWHNITVKEFKRRENIQELRRCDLVSRIKDDDWAG